jgi:hypothetical protein
MVSRATFVRITTAIKVPIAITTTTTRTIKTKIKRATPLAATSTRTTGQDSSPLSNHKVKPNKVISSRPASKTARTRMARKMDAHTPTSPTRTTTIQSQRISRTKARITTT